MLAAPITDRTNKKCVGKETATHKMPGHWLLAKLGKRVLRPGGLELTRQLLGQLEIQPTDDVVEFAPGLGITAQMALARNPASYIAVERDAAAAETVRRYLSGPTRHCVTGSADDTGLPSDCASIVYGEAMLSMQPATTKERVVAEAARLLRPGGRYGIHELCLMPDEVNESLREQIQQEMSGETVCPSRALHYGTWEEIEHDRPRSVPHNSFLFGRQEVRTKVYMMVPREAQPEIIDVLSALEERGADQVVTLNVLSDADPMLANLYDGEGN